MLAHSTYRANGVRNVKMEHFLPDRAPKEAASLQSVFAGIRAKAAETKALARKKDRPKWPPARSAR